MKSGREAKRVHLYMIKHGFIPGLFLGNRLVNVYINCGMLDYARQVFDKMSTRDVVSWTTILAGYAKMGFINHARQIFDEMPDRNVVSWNAMIAAYAQQGCGEEALQLFCKMQKAGVKSKSVTFVAILSAIAGLEGLEPGKQIHAFILKAGFESNVFVGSALLDMYAKCRCIKDAHQVFDKMPERNIVSWNVMVDGHGKYGSISEARYLFDNMVERSVASWTAMISGYAQRGDAEEALKLFCQMQQSLSQPDQFTYACVFSICASLAALGYGKQVHARILRIAFESYTPVGNGLVTMYAKCGSIKDAHNVFDKLPLKNVVSWTSIISGYAMHGCGYDAVKLFQQMEQAGIKPNCITFLNVLSACSHSGLVDIGLSYFTSMTEKHGIIPNIDHYSCMVGLLGRAGCLDLVKNFLNNMPCEPDTRLWSALLGISRINDHAELGKHAAEALFQLEPNNSATYILLSNIYAAAGRWNDVAKVRKMMREKGIKKLPGWSWIEIKNKVHTFVVGDEA
ncbi:pentatricopeptide repeat-containing protein At4g02750 isoform X2 [Cryptomeria japonica]|nr:pentatricopeptide repeat-containing protein At4g02750 isoform X2 [Cryptomeria japonica]